MLGTEAGMITAIVERVERVLADANCRNIDVEIIFPVATDAVAINDELNLGILPGVAGGEGCSTAGGCATCPYMKMNSLDAMLDVLESVGTDRDLTPLEPKKYTELIDGRTAADIGCEPILHMRHFQRTDELPDALVDAIRRQAGRPQAVASAGRGQQVSVDGVRPVLGLDTVSQRGACGDTLELSAPRGASLKRTGPARGPHPAALGSAVDLGLLGKVSS